MSNSYEARWTRALGETDVGKNRTETVYSFIKAFKRSFDGNGPVLDEVSRMLSSLYEIKTPDKKLGSYYIDRLVEKGLIEVEAARVGDSQRSPGRILLKEGCWSCWEANQELELGSNRSNHDKAIAGAVQKQSAIESNGDLVGEESLL